LPVDLASVNGKGLRDKYPPTDNPTCFPCAFALHAINASRAISCLLKSYIRLRQNRWFPEHRTHSVSAQGHHYGAHVCLCLASEVIAQGSFDEKGSSWSGGISRSTMHGYREPSLLLHATCCEDGGAPVAHYGLQSGGVNDAEAPARPGASSQLCSKSQNGCDLTKCRRTLHSALPPASPLSRKSGTAAYILDVNRNRQNPADLYKLLNIYGIRKYCPIVDVTSSAPP
jgi:hypothetical protein